MNINEELNCIIFKYNIDQYYPHYRNMYKAEKILRNIINEIICHKKKAIFVGNNSKGREFIQNISREYTDIHFFCYERNDHELRILETVQWEQYEEIYLFSFYDVEYIERWLRLHKKSFQWIYSYFEEEGISLQREFFAFGQTDMIVLVDKDGASLTRSGYTGTLQCELYSQESRYKYTKDLKMKRIALEKCLFLALYMKNFIAAEKYAALLFKEDEKYECFWREIEDLLDTIKRKVKNQEKKDIVMYWLDALPYGEENNMPYLQSMTKQSVIFENAFTNIAYTRSTARALFLGKRDIDDEVYDVSDFTEENSPVLRNLKKQGYHIKINSGMLNSLFPFSCVSEQFYMDVYDPCSMKLWDMLSDMICQKKKTFYLVHALEAHDPYLSSKMSDDNYNDANERCRVAKMELDEQLAFYDSFLNENNFRIYMSDHGRESVHKFHVIFNIYQKTLRPRKIEGMFSLLDFYKVIEQIIMGGNIKEEKFTRDYLEIGNLDKYNKIAIEKILKKERQIEERIFGCKGIIDENYIYLCNTIGKEQLLRREDIPLCDPLLFYDAPVSEPELLPKYRKLTGKYPENMLKEEKFRYSKYLYRLYYNLKKKGGQVTECVQMINELLSVYAENSVAIRVGGYHSLVLFHILFKENKKKIWGFVDNNDKCICSRLNMPVISPKQAAELTNAGVNAILLSSYDLIGILRKEAELWPANMDVLDIYDYFEKHGIVCSTNFYNVTGSDEDYEVGYPFEEANG